jgi:hypothetical protein
VSEDAKHFALSWLGECLAANSGRGQMWTSQMGPLLAASYASDGFMLNLGSTLLRQPTPTICTLPVPDLIWTVHYIDVFAFDSLFLLLDFSASRQWPHAVLS